MDGRRTNKGQRFPVEVLTPDEVRALLTACSSRAPTGIRNRALITVLYRGGLRLSYDGSPASSHRRRSGSHSAMRAGRSMYLMAALALHFLLPGFASPAYLGLRRPIGLARPFF